MPRPLIGVTSLAEGTDQLFTELVLETGGAIEVVVPFSGYERTFDKPADQEQFERLKHRAARIETLSVSDNPEEAYRRAGERVADLSDLLVAVWDGKPAHGIGGTADIVRYALSSRKPVIRLNPVSRRVLRQRGGHA
jgi:hypothetical protein